MQFSMSNAPTTFRKTIRLFLLFAAIATLLLAASTLLTPDHPIPTFAETKAKYQPSEA